MIHYVKVHDPAKAAEYVGRKLDLAGTPLAPYNRAATASEIAERLKAGEPGPSLAAPDQLPAHSARKRDYLVQRANLEGPLNDGETPVEDDFASYLLADFRGIPAGTVAVCRRTNRAEYYYFLPCFRVEGGQIRRVRMAGMADADAAVPDDDRIPAPPKPGEAARAIVPAGPAALPQGFTMWGGPGAEPGQRPGRRHRRRRRDARLQPDLREDGQRAGVVRRHVREVRAGRARGLQRPVEEEHRGRDPHRRRRDRPVQPHGQHRPAPAGREPDRPARAGHSGLRPLAGRQLHDGRRAPADGPTAAGAGRGQPRRLQEGHRGPRRPLRRVGPDGPDQGHRRPHGQDHQGRADQGRPDAGLGLPGQRDRTEVVVPRHPQRGQERQAQHRPGVRHPHPERQHVDQRGPPAGAGGHGAVAEAGPTAATAARRGGGAAGR